MKIEYYKEYSRYLNRDMEFKVYGHSGKPILVFPCQDGRFFDYENQGMITTVQEYVDSGRIQFFCVDSIDKESWSDKYGNPRHRSEMQENYFHYVCEEMVPHMFQISRDCNGGYQQKACTTGNSMGASHALNFFLRRPDLFDSVIALSGIYESTYFYGDYMDDLLYLNTPELYMKNLSLDHPYIQLYNQSKIILCVGQGAWEDEMLASTHTMQKLFQEKGISAWCDFWGKDVNHDWPWWRIQLPYFMKYILD